jgi:hypothetical protein
MQKTDCKSEIAKKTIKFKSTKAKKQKNTILKLFYFKKYLGKISQ